MAKGFVCTFCKKAINEDPVLDYGDFYHLDCYGKYQAQVLGVAKEPSLTENDKKFLKCLRIGW